MIKLLIIGIVLFYAYRLWIVPMLDAAKGEDNNTPQVKNKQNRQGDDDYIDYEEIK